MAAKKTVDDFRAAHDKSYIVPRRIQAAIAKLGPNSWDYEADFLRNAGVANSSIGAFRGQFSDFIVETSGQKAKRVWCGSKALATKLRAMAAA